MVGASVDPAQYALLDNAVKRLPDPPRKPVTITVLYCMVMVINGGLVGAFGPSLEPFSRKTGASMGVLGGAIMQNRLAKLGGTVVWGYFANRVQQTAPGEQCALPPHTLMAGSLLLLAACCAVFGFTRDPFALQAVMITSGFMYGVSDSGANLMITWVWQVRAARAAARQLRASSASCRAPCHAPRARARAITSTRTTLSRVAWLCVFFAARRVRYLGHSTMCASSGSTWRCSTRCSRWARS